MGRTQTSIVKEIRAAFEREPRVNPHRSPIGIKLQENGTVLLQGEVACIEVKRLAVECAKSIDGVRQIVDCLTVQPTSRLGDGAIRDSVCRHLFEERVFLRTAISCRIEGDTQAISQNLDGSEDRIEAAVADGVVKLCGHVLSLSHSRLAAVLAWWAPGCRNVVNELEITPPESDNDDEISDAVKIVLEKDPLVHSDQVVVQIRNREVVLRGVVANNEEKRMATRDVWYIEGVRNVIDALDVSPTRAPGAPMFSAPRAVE